MPRVAHRPHMAYVVTHTFLISLVPGYSNLGPSTFFPKHINYQKKITCFFRFFIFWHRKNPKYQKWHWMFTTFATADIAISVLLISFFIIKRPQNAHRKTAQAFEVEPLSKISALPVPLQSQVFLRVKTAPRRLQDAPRHAKTFNDTLRCAQDAPRTAQDASKRSPRCFQAAP